MHCLKCFVFVLLLISFKFNTVTAQNEISEILEPLGIDLQDIINILDAINTEAICEYIKSSLRDDLCSTQLNIICGNESFMSKMLDASSKFPYSGMMVRTRIDYGSYDECINLDLSQDGVRVIGKHCTGGIVIPTTELNDTEFLEKAYKLSICIPDGCSALNLMDILHINSELQVINDAHCSTKESWKILAAADYSVIAFLISIVTIMIISTMYDVYLYYTNQECPHVLLQAFSMYYNGKKLLQVSKVPSDQIKVIHGLRVISMMWIVAAHSYGTMSSYPGVNIDFPSNFEWRRKSTYITTAYLAVDTFFFLSGLLLAYQYLKQDPKPLKTHITRIPYLYLHRYLRLTPAVGVAFLFVVTVFGHLGNGPIYFNIETEQDTCLKYWWSYFLYIQNYVNYDNMCITTMWYLSADWQLFLISPIVLIPVAIFIKRSFKWIIAYLVLLNIFLVIAPVGLKFAFNDFTNLSATHGYLIDYFMGFMLGVFMREKCNLKYRFNAICNFVLWLIILFIMVLTILTYKEIQLLRYYSNDLKYFSYYIPLRAVWCICLSWIVYSCHNGYGGFINWLLTTPLVQVLSKLTFCLYITHIAPIMYFRLTARLPLVYSQITAIEDAILSYFISLILATFWSLAFESPIIILEKYFMGAKMLDASSKFPYSGMLITTRIDYGSYDECINLDLSQDGIRVIGKHCTGGIILPTTDFNDTEFFKKAFKLSICIPDGCSALDLMEMLHIPSNMSLINDASCSTKDDWKILGADDYAALSFILAVITIMVISTIYDVYLSYTNQECPHILLRAFSMYYNGKKLLQVSKGPSDQIKVLHGLRVFSMIWVVAGHTFSTIGLFPVINTDYVLDVQWSRQSIYISTAHMGVDTFFFLSGLLLSYQYLKQEPRPLKMHIKRIPYLYLHRYIRITPSAAVAFIFVITLFSHLGNGPLYSYVQNEKDACLKYWWSYFLYIQNYANYGHECIMPTWYLSVDWQIFLVSPIILIPVALFVKGNFKWIIMSLFLLNIFFTITPIGLKFAFHDFNNLYETHAYLNDYFIGFMLGVFMREKCNSKYRFNTIWNFIIWTIVIFSMLLTILFYKEIQLIRYHSNDSSYYSYLILARALWCTGLSWIVYSCHNGYGGFVNWILTNRLVQVLSKLTFCLYMSHIYIVMYFRLTARLPFVFRQLAAVQDTIAFYFMSLILATFWTLAFESPIIIMEKYLMGRKNRLLHQKCLSEGSIA